MTKTKAAKRRRPAAAARRRSPASGAARAATPGPTQERRASPQTIVGIGGSAGSLEALTRILRDLPPDINLALVVIQHLSRQHGSLLPELLAAASRLRVVQVREGMALSTGCVHVIPPGVHMTLLEGRLHLVPRPHDHTQHNPIDLFFRSLAQYARARAIAIVLSGSASDGALGLHEIKASGGITIVQDPSTAAYSGMPRAAIETGAVDLVLAPEQIAAELRRLEKHPFTTAAGDENGESSTADFDRLFKVLRGTTGVDFTEYKLPTIKRRLQRRMALQRMHTLTEYVSRLEKDPGEVRLLYRDILIHVTRFFREPDSFDALKRLVFPRVLADSPQKRPVRVWVPGCATGEEAYSVAIALLEFLGAEATILPIQVFATDVSEEAIEKARAGVYPASIGGAVSQERLRRFFTRVDGSYRISKLVRDACIFARQDLTRDPPFSKLDLIVCRNVLIYLAPRLQRRLMAMFHYALKPSGFLMLGGTESAGQHGELFALVDKHKIYTKRAKPAAPLGTAAAYATSPDQPANTVRRPPAKTAAAANDLQSQVTRLLLGRYTPPAVVVDHEYQIVQTRGKTGLYLELASGAPSLNVLKLAREGLLHGMRSALHEAQRSLKPARRDALTVRVNGHSREVSVQVLPVGDGRDFPYFLVLFEKHTRAEPADPRAKAAKKSKGEETRLTRMRHELSSSRDYLQSIIQDLEAANEELQSANEEILSNNEELQSTNEELDTAKEELQSTNEELNTVTEELNARNEELSHVNSDLVNLLTAVPAAIVIVNADLRIRRFTPLAEHVLNLIPTDVGRPISDIRTNLDTPNLDELTREVIETVNMKQLVVADRTGRQYSLRIRPYTNQENRIDGAVLSFAEQVDAGDGMVGEHRFIESVLAITPCGLLVVQEDLRVKMANPTAIKLLGESSPAAVQGRRVEDIAGGSLNQPALMRKLTRATTTKQAFADVELSAAGGQRLRFDGRTFAGLAAEHLLVLVTIHAAG